MKKKRFLIVLAILTIFAISAKAQVPPIEPLDTDSNNIRNVSTLNHLQWMIVNFNYYYTDDYELDNDINASSTVNWNNGAGFEPIGYYWGYPFLGTFNGNNHRIDSLYINRTGMSLIGLFSSSNGLIKDLSLTNCHIVGNQYVGALTGINSGIVENCSSTGYVEGYTQYGTGHVIGGLVGCNTKDVISSHSSAEVIGCELVGGLIGWYNTEDVDSKVTKCFSTGEVKGIDYVGGLIGLTQGYSSLTKANISKCYSVSNVTGQSYKGGLLGAAINNCMINNSYAMGRVVSQTPADNCGGFIGYVNSSCYVTNCYSQGAVVIPSGYYLGGFIGQCGDPLKVTNCFWDEYTSGLTTGYPVNGNKSHTAMFNQLTFTNWDFSNIWDINPNENGRYPYLRDVAPEINVLEPVDTDNDGFSNITNTKHLRWLSEYDLGWSLNYELDNSIFLDGTSKWNFGSGFSPIGNATKNFTGQFDGNNYYIERIFIDRPTEDFIGFFGKVSKGAQIRNLCLRHCNFTGRDYVGGLAGWVENNNDTPLLLLPIENCVTTGDINGRYNVGGLIGSIVIDFFAPVTGTSVSKSCSKCFVYGSENVGGLVGFNTGWINNCYSRGRVDGLTNTGGAFGTNDGNGLIEKCYSTGEVSEPNLRSGLIAENGQYSQVLDSYWDIITSNNLYSDGGGIGTTTYFMTRQATFVGWDFINIWECIALENDNYPSFIGVPYYKMNLDNYEFNITSENIKLDIFPNPISSETYITINTNKDIFANIFIYNTLGQVVKSCYSGNISKGTKNLNLNLQDLNEGSYYLIIENNSVLSCKMIVISR